MSDPIDLEPSELESMRQQARAWDAVVSTLDRCAPGWRRSAATGKMSACDTISNMAEQLARLRAADESRKRRDAAVDELVAALKMARARIQNLSEAIMDAKELGLTVAICGDEFDGNAITAALAKATALAAIKGEAK